MDDGTDGRRDGFRESFISSLSLGASPLLPYNCCSIPFKSAPALLLHPRLFLPPQNLNCQHVQVLLYLVTVCSGEVSFFLSVRLQGKLHCSFTICNNWASFHCLCSRTFSGFFLCEGHSQSSSTQAWTMEEAKIAPNEHLFGRQCNTLHRATTQSSP